MGPYLSYLLYPHRLLIQEMASTPTDGRIDSRIQNYTNFWQKDTRLDSKVDTDARVDNYTEVINGEIVRNHILLYI